MGPLLCTDYLPLCICYQFEKKPNETIIFQYHNYDKEMGIGRINSIILRYTKTKISHEKKIFVL